MPSAIDFAHCLRTDSNGREVPLSHVDPYYAIRYQFGMLLGVEDFETEQAYHRGKIRLHNAWLHREGVVWGLAVEPRDASDPADLVAGELRVQPGLAIDAAGHELHLDGPACLNLPLWYDKHKDEQALRDVVRTSGTGAGKVFDAHVVMRFRACLTRQVPALVEPCDGSVSDTTYSRVAETVRIDLVPGLAPASAAPYHNLRVLFGLDAFVPADDTILAAEMTRLRGIADPSRLRDELLATIRTLAAADAAMLRPALDPDGTTAGLFPGGEEQPIVLCNVRDITLEPEVGGRVRLAGLRVDDTVRRTHVATAALQDLVYGLLFALAPDPAAPRFTRAELVDPTTIRLRADADLARGTVVAAAFTITTHSGTPADGWVARTATVTLDGNKRDVTLTLDGAGVTAGHIVRVIARGTGATPILGENLRALAGGPPWLGNGGHDYVVTLSSIL